jgi:hypothetical protein
VAVLILSWFVVAFLFALSAHTLVRDDGHVDVDVTLILGTAGALIMGAFANHAFGEPPWGMHVAGFVGGAMGALGGVGLGAIGQRRRAA